MTMPQERYPLRRSPRPGESLDAYTARMASERWVALTTLAETAPKLDQPRCTCVPYWPRGDARHVCTCGTPAPIDPCASRSPQSDLPCRLPRNHDGCHEATESEYVTACWAHTSEELEASPKGTT